MTNPGVASIEENGHSRRSFMKLLFPLLAFPLLLSIPLLASAEPAETLSPSLGQLGAEISWTEIPDSDNLFHAVQFTRDGKLFLTPNESFFPKLGLTATGEGSVADVSELNGGKSFSAIEKWDAGDAAEWGIWLKNSGSLEVNVRMSGGPGRFTLSLGEQAESFSLRGGSEPATVATTTFTISEPGRHLIRLTCDDGGDGAAFHWIEISGPAAADGGVIRKRWRPAAAHTRFTSSRSPDKVRLWVMEMDAFPGELDFYSPITTPFGYYGPTWKADGLVNTCFNFSLWSFGRNQPEPPVEQLSHLLAIGNPEAKFSGFDHEGTGVKIREWEPLEGRQGQRQALALRVEPGEKYDTYFSYFYAADEKRWRLFGAGNKWNKGRPIEHLWVGSFVEVPGPPPVQRTGAWERTMRYRGWVMNDRGQLFPLDQMQRGNVDQETGLTHTDRGITEDGWFYLRTGGWVFRKVRDGAPVQLPEAARPDDVDYLNEDDIAFLTSVPSQIVVTKLERADTRARVTLAVKNAGEKAKASIHWGSEDGLTLLDRWPNRVESTDPIRDGENQFIFDGIPEKEPLFVRVLLTNNEGQFWTPETAEASP